MKEKLIEIKKFIGSLNLTTSLSKKYRGKGVIFYFHQVLTDDDFANIPRPNNDLAISVSSFTKHIQFLKKNCNIVHLKELYRNNNLAKNNKLNVAITFDDGYLDNLTNAFKILKKYNAPATIYITTSYINDKKIPWWIDLWSILQNVRGVTECYLLHNNITINKNNKIYAFKKISYFLIKKKTNEIYLFLNKLRKSINLKKSKSKRIFLNRKEIKKLSKNKLITIGAHTHNHENLKLLTYKNSKKEIMKSKKILENIIKKRVDDFAIPYGTKDNFDSKEIDILVKNGFKSNVTTINKPFFYQSNFILPRIGLGNHDDKKSLNDKITGWNFLVKKFI
jgi:peptidoglycan/xylan/chitin deacetylase (PgdA/CDA1 family)